MGFGQTTYLMELTKEHRTDKDNTDRFSGNRNRKRLRFEYTDQYDVWLQLRQHSHMSPVSSMFVAFYRFSLFLLFTHESIVAYLS
jgi:hypothetical protein